MKLTFSSLATPEWTVDQTIDRAKHHGYDGVDWRGSSAGIDVTTQPEFTTGLSATHSKLDSLGLQTPCLCSSIVLHTIDPARWNASLEEFARTVLVADALDCPFIRIFPGPTPKDFSPEQAIDLSRRHIRQLLKMSTGHRVRPLLETHDDWNTGARLAPLLEAFDTDECPVLWDVRHSFRSGEPLQTTLDLLGPRIQHIHFKDDRVVDGKSKPTLIGAGEVPVAEATRLLLARGYQGWFCLENEKRWIKDAPEPDEILPQYVAYMRAL